MPIELVKADGLARGERAILVDGVRWGHTRVTWHGCHGTKTCFVQEGGSTIRTVDEGEVYVWGTGTRRQWLRSEEWRPTEDVVLDTIRGLIADGLLRHPAVVKRERDEILAKMELQRINREAREAREFRARALEAAGSDDPDLIGRIVAAMRWAQLK